MSMTLPKKKASLLSVCTGIFFGILLVSNFFTIHSNGSTYSLTRYAVPHSSSYWHESLPNLQRHIATPERVGALYLSAWSAGTIRARDRVISLIKDSPSLNSVIIDVKDNTGYISYTGTSSTAKEENTYSRRITNIRNLIQELHKNDIYIIARIAVFDDPVIIKNHPEWELDYTDGTPWNRDGKRSWVDPSKTEYWDYITTISREAYSLGFDEINLDYIRYPSENIQNGFSLPESETKSDVITGFLTHINDELRKKSNIPVSIDVFGLTTTASDDVGIGQDWQRMIPLVDYIAPMIYPSHYASGSFGVENPASQPHIIVQRALEGAIKKTQEINEPVTKIRPWIQDFDLGARYTPSMVFTQIDAAYSLDIVSYMVWDPKNKYTPTVYTKLLDYNEESSLTANNL